VRTVPFERLRADPQIFVELSVITADLPRSPS
jgi:hypothetical protein